MSHNPCDGAKKEDYFIRYGRYYASWRPEKYLFPIDREEINRLDMIHKLFLVVQQDDLYLAPLAENRPLRIMDLGTGSGIWAIHVAESRTGRQSEIMTVDLHRFQPQYHLLPESGYLEHVEIEWVPRWDENDVDEKGEGMPDSPSALEEWSNLYMTGLETLGRNGRIDGAAIRQTIEDVGFTDVEEKTIRLYMSPWMPQSYRQEGARWLNMCFTRGVEGMSLWPMIIGLGMREDEVRGICERAIYESLEMRLRTYFNA
ncbi:LaeA protein [Metarhizium guizhouense ARSEF 977]|uniref:LaeA protein n=1 Tax=Metarhizium guizhouense (strain ARSEF 977) TaxID=1276136 RepID=A0A0B4GR59_METGA|nr:LaeA protein [Metarhizium guizhouense ARSEF 977]